MTAEIPVLLQGAALLEAVSAAQFPCLGVSREGRAITGTRFPARRDHPDLPDLPLPRLLFFGGIHGDEPATVEALLDLARRLARPAAPSSRGEIWIVPVLNPDGVSRGWKNAASDVDLNRNFPARNFSRAHAPGYDPGPAPLSEPESALLADLIDAQAIDAVVAVHAPFACVNFDGPAGPWAEAVSAAAGWPVRQNIGYPTPGSFGSWFGNDRGLPVLTLELPPGDLNGFRQTAAAALDAAWTAVPDLRRR